MKKFVIFLATGLGTGLAPIIPGTIGTLPAVGLAILFRFNLLSLLIISLVGIYICNRAEILLNEHDPGKIVFDEIVGFLIATYLIPLNLLWLSFIAFRFFDMVKPFPINKLQELKGGYGVMADDIAAGIVANLLVHGLILYFH